MSHRGAAIRVFSSDLDGTLLGDPDSEETFRRTWDSLEIGKRPLLVYNSGRTIRDMRCLIAAKRIPSPDYLIGGVGTQLHDWRTRCEISGFDADFGGGWDLAKIEEIVGAIRGVEMQPPQFLHPYKSSWYWLRAETRQIETLRQRLCTAGLRVNVIYSNERDLDVLPSRAGKGEALQWLCTRLNVALEQVVVAGDTGNDSSMFLLPGVKRILMANAHRELFEAVDHRSVFIAHTAHAAGVLEGLHHFGVICQRPPSVPT